MKLNRNSTEKKDPLKKPNGNGKIGSYTRITILGEI